MPSFSQFVSFEFDMAMTIKTIFTENVRSSFCFSFSKAVAFDPIKCQDNNEPEILDSQRSNEEKKYNIYALELGNVSILCSVVAVVVILFFFLSKILCTAQQLMLISISDSITISQSIDNMRIRIWQTVCNFSTNVQDPYSIFCCFGLNFFFFLFSLLWLAQGLTEPYFTLHGFSFATEPFFSPCFFFRKK